jgi:hypothetical protein
MECWSGDGDDENADDVADQALSLEEDLAAAITDTDVVGRSDDEGFIILRLLALPTIVIQIERRLTC